MWCRVCRDKFLETLVHNPSFIFIILYISLEFKNVILLFLTLFFNPLCYRIVQSVRPVWCLVCQGKFLETLVHNISFTSIFCLDCPKKIIYGIPVCMFQSMLCFRNGFTIFNIAIWFAFLLFVVLFCHFNSFA